MESSARGIRQSLMVWAEFEAHQSVWNVWISTGALASAIAFVSTAFLAMQLLLQDPCVH